MKRFLRILSFALGLAPAAAFAQGALLQGGPTTAGHSPMYVQTGSGQAVVQDSGPASGGPVGMGLSELLITSRSPNNIYPSANTGSGPLNTHLCMYDAPNNNATGYHYLCFDPNAQGGALVTYGSAGGATALPLSFVVNGSSYAFPFVTGGIVGPSTSVVGDAACWNNLIGTLLADCGPFVTVSGNNTWSGTNNFTGPFQINGVAQTFPASGSIVGTSDVQTLTNKNINAAQINSGTLPATVMPALTGDVTSAAGSVATTLGNSVVTNAKLAAATQNTVKGAATSTAVSDLAVPSCSTSSSALQWLTNTGFQCGSLSVQSAGWGLALNTGVLSVSTTAPPFGFTAPVNMGMTAVAAGSNLTINITTAAGATPSATNPVLVPFRSTTLTSGAVNWEAITAALSLVIPSGATLGTTNNVPFRIWLFMTANGGTPQVGAAVCSSAATIFPCASWETNRQTTVAITGLAATSGVLYATSGVSNDAVRIIGYCDFASGLATVGAWASACTTLQIMGPGIKKPGDLIQTVFAQSATAAQTATTYTPSATLPTTANGALAVATPSFTATSSPNLIRLRGVATGSLVTATAATFVGYLATGTTVVNAGAVVGSTAATALFSVPLSYQVLAPSSGGTPSATVYAIYVIGTGSSSSNAINQGTAALFTGAAISNLTVEEIMGALPEPANDNINPGVLSLTG